MKSILLVAVLSVLSLVISSGCITSSNLSCPSAYEGQAKKAISNIANIKGKDYKGEWRVSIVQPVGTTYSQTLKQNVGYWMWNNIKVCGLTWKNGNKTQMTFHPTTKVSPQAYWDHERCHVLCNNGIAAPKDFFGKGIIGWEGEMGRKDSETNGVSVLLP